MLFAKIHAYALNAYLDAQIAEEIVSYVKSEGESFATDESVSQQRAEKLVTASDKNFLKKDLSFLIGLAYTEYYLNGLADILYANLFWSLYISTQKARLRNLYLKSIARFRLQLTAKFQYDEIIYQPGIALWYWPAVILDPWRWVNRFARERCGYNGRLDKNSLRVASIEVQKQNMQNNYQVARALLRNSKYNDPKVVELRKLAAQLDNSSIFLIEAAATQKAAAKWDNLFIKLIFLLYGEQFR